MGIRKLKTFELSCDGERLYTVMGERLQDRCDSTTTMQAASLNELRADLQVVGSLRDHDGWRWIAWCDELLCPRRDHLGAGSETLK